MIALCVIGGVAAATWLQSYRVGQFVAKLSSPGGFTPKAGGTAI